MMRQYSGQVTPVGTQIPTAQQTPTNTSDITSQNYKQQLNTISAQLPADSSQNTTMTLVAIGLGLGLLFWLTK